MRTFLLSLVAFAGCGRDAVPVPVASESPPSPARTLDPSRELSPLVARLAYESEHRVPSTLPADRVLDALAQADVAVVSRKQYLGLTVRATYCMGGATRDGVAIAVCEYTDAAAARAGKTFMDQQFAAMAPTARRATHGATVLTIVDPSAATDPARAERVLEVFAAL